MLWPRRTDRHTDGQTHGRGNEINKDRQTDRRTGKQKKKEEEKFSHIKSKGRFQRYQTPEKMSWQQKHIFFKDLNAR